MTDDPLCSPNVAAHANTQKYTHEHRAAASGKCAALPMVNYDDDGVKKN
jgi:hypothetical protein